jgi:hypothetical protein
LKIVADPSQPKNRLIRPLADFGGSAVHSLSPASLESLKPPFSKVVVVKVNRLK